MTLCKQIIVETFYAVNERSTRKIRVRPLDGQGYSNTWRVSFPEALRFSTAVGTLFKVRVTVCNRGPHLKASGPYTIVSRNEADAFMECTRQQGVSPHPGSALSSK
jgi:hypothetical protein